MRRLHQHGVRVRPGLRAAGCLAPACQEFAFRRAGKILQAVLVLGIALTLIDVDWELWRAAMVVQMVVLGFVIFGAIWVMASSIARPSPFMDTPVRQLSLGQKMRGEITAALLHDPSILYLDEPTIGLDVVSKSRVREFLARVNRELGVTVILTTHDLSDVERFCSRLMVIDLGRLVYDGTVDDLKARHGQYRTLVVDLERPNGPLDVVGADVVRVEGPRQWLRFHRDRTTAAELIARIARTTPILDLTVEEPLIEDVIARMYAGNQTGGPSV